jgi:uncharacterized hydrophobic protein (TIGR00271 family)
MDDASKPQLNNLAHMRDAVLFEGPTSHQRYTRFWILLILASIIAAAGVVGNSDATVIGAMIVAPLMLPIQGTMLATVLGDRVNLVRSLALLVTGALSSVAIGWLVGLLVRVPITAETNAQVAQRAAPTLIDLLAALAVGVVGSIALVRKDISDTLPGVAIAISLVPPLVVVGLTIESGAYGNAFGSLILFLTNVVAIIGTGIVVMAVYGESRLASPPTATQSVRRGSAVAVLAVMAVLVIVPLAWSSVYSTTVTNTESTVHDVVQSWGAPHGWQVVQVDTEDGIVNAQVEGPPPAPDTAGLKQALVDAGIDPDHVVVELVPVNVVDFGADD